MSSLLSCSGKPSKAKGRSKRSKRKDSLVPSEKSRLEELEEVKSSSSSQETAALKQHHEDLHSNISIPPTGEDEQISSEGNQLIELLERVEKFKNIITELEKDLESEKEKSEYYEQEVAELKKQLDELKGNQHTNMETAIGVSIPSKRNDGSIPSEAERRIKELEDENGKLKEDLKDERNKSKTEAAKLKQQLEELKRNYESSKAIELAMSVPKPTESKLNDDTDTLLIQAKIANEAASVLWKQKRKINKKQLQEHSKTIHKCIEKYNSSFVEISDANKRMLNILSEDGFIEMTQGQKRKLSCSLNELNRESERLQTVCMVCPKKESKIKELEERLKRFEGRENENELQLSATVSSKLRDNNPNIADLSDQNRPTKIAEKLSELFDNQWKDAYDALQTNRMKETEIIEILKDLMFTVLRKCKSIASKKYFVKVQRFIELPVQGVSVPKVSVLPDTLKQQIKDFRKRRAEFVIEDLEKVIKNELKSAHSHLEAVQTYISCCIEISWLMAVQDPPLVLSTEEPSKFDTNLFKYHTRQGKYVDYVVWPALYLKEGGAVLAKGVVQGSDHSRRTQ